MKERLYTDDLNGRLDLSSRANIKMRGLSSGDIYHLERHLPANSVSYQGFLKSLARQRASGMVCSDCARIAADLGV